MFKGYRKLYQSATDESRVHLLTILVMTTLMILITSLLVTALITGKEDLSFLVSIGITITAHMLASRWMTKRGVRMDNSTDS